MSTTGVTKSSGQRLHHVLQLSDLEGLPQPVVGARPLWIQIKPAARQQRLQRVVLDEEQAALHRREAEQYLK